MQVHWIKKDLQKQEIGSFKDDNYPHALMRQLIARIARRPGRWRCQMRSRHLKSVEPEPTLPSAA